MRHNQEYNQQLLETLIGLIEPFDTPILFDSACVVKPTPHAELFRCYGVVKNMHNEVKLLGPDEEWHHIEIHQANAGYVLQSVNQRLKSMNMQKSFC